MDKRASPGGTMTIGELARQAGVGVQTVRYYERRRLLPEAPRRASGYRAFAPAALERLRFIRRAQELGFTLSEIAELLALRLDPHTTAADVKAQGRGENPGDREQNPRSRAHQARTLPPGRQLPRRPCPHHRLPAARGARLSRRSYGNMTTTDNQLDLTETVHDLVQRCPATLAVFQRYGVDTCCGSGVSVEAAARRDGLDADRLYSELREAAKTG